MRNQTLAFPLEPEDADHRDPLTLALGGCQGNRLNGSTAAPVAVGGDLGGLGVGNGGVTDAGRGQRPCSWVSA